MEILAHWLDAMGLSRKNIRLTQDRLHRLVTHAQAVKIRASPAAESVPSIPAGNCCVPLELVSDFRRVLNLRTAAGQIAIVTILKS